MIMGHLFNKSTLLGFCALLMWAIMTLLMSELTAMPLFQMTTCIFSTTFLIISVKLTVKQQWARVRQQPLWVWALGVMGVCGSDYCYIAAFKYAPPAHIDFIDYLWPFLIILLSGLLPKEKLTFPQIVGGILCMVGVYFLLLASGKPLSFTKMVHFKGYAFALMGALAWSLFNIVSKMVTLRIPLDMYGMYAGIGAIVSLMFHVGTENWKVPTLYEGSLIVLSGLCALAYLLWDCSSRVGSLKILSLLAYFTPIMSMTFLVIAGKQAFSFYLVLACFLVICGVTVGSLDWGTVFKKGDPKSPETARDKAMEIGPFKTDPSC